MLTNPDDLAAWIADLRERVAHGELDGQDTFTADETEVAVGLAARILLADLDHDLDLTPEQRRDPFNVERRRILTDDLRRLREQIG